MLEELPSIVTTPKEKESIVPPPNVRVEKKTLLYVDDEEHNLRVFRASFRREYNVILTTNPLEAVELVRQGDIDVLVTDQRMPQMTGTQMIEALRPEFPELIAIIITGYTDINTITHAVNKCNIFRYVTKPYDIDDLKNSLQQAIQLSSLRDEKKQLLENLEEANRDLEAKVHSRTAELMEVNHSLTSSIEYAKHIQAAALSGTSETKEFFEDQFELLLPQNIVSGDFFYRTQIGQCILIAAFDCTGHGVPGAFLSILGINAIEKACAQGLEAPLEILKEINNDFHRRLKLSTYTIHDGMDGSLIMIDPVTKQLHYTGTRSEFIYSNGKELQRIRSSKAGLGDSFWVTSDVIEVKTINLEKVTSFYLYSDGYKDQLNPESKRIMTSGFMKLLRKITSLTMDLQKKELESFLSKWKQTEEQTDDIMVLGFQLPKLV